jgi:hypothetical protein
VYRAVGTSAFCLLLAAGCVALATAIGFSDQLSWAILVLAGLFLFGAAALGLVAFRMSQDLSAGVVLNIEGLVQPSVRVTNIKTGALGPGMPVWTFYWLVGDQRFAVNGKAYGVLTPARHRLYFLPRTRRVVAAEPINHGK